MKQNRGSRQTGVILLCSLFVLHVSAPGVSALDVKGIIVTAMPAWIYNGFTVDDEGDPVQGSDVSPIRMTFGAGTELRFNDRHRLEPHLWIYLQEYGALRAYDKTVPTQIETGAVVADIANTLSLAVSVPWLYTLPWPQVDNWRFSVGTGIALVFRIPIQDIDGTDGSTVGSYWIENGRFLYPQVQLSVDRTFGDVYEIGAGAEWFIPVYNAWSQEETAPFLDETMVRLGLRVRRRFP